MKHCVLYYMKLSKSSVHLCHPEVWVSSKRLKLFRSNETSWPWSMSRKQQNRRRSIMNSLPPHAFLLSHFLLPLKENRQRTKESEAAQVGVEIQLPIPSYAFILIWVFPIPTPLVPDVSLPVAHFNCNKFQFVKFEVRWNQIHQFHHS